MASDQKDTIYVDVDDEITSIIDKLQSSSKQIVALVLPKRASVFQSVVNMKLLKKTAENSKKHLVLITSEASLMPLAGVVGIRVAKTLQSKPFMPDSPLSDDAQEDNPDTEDPILDKQVSVGELSGLPDEEPILIDNSKPTPADTTPKKVKKNKKFNIPNFEKFRTKIILVILGIFVLIGLWYLMFMALPKATITIKTDTSNIDTSFDFIADTNAQRVDLDNSILPAVSKDYSKTDSEKVPATGTKDLGTKAAGTITLSIDCGVPITVPAGTGISTGSLTFISKSDIEIFSYPDSSGGGCKYRKQVDVTAQNGGEQYNLSSGKSFTVAGYSAVSGTNEDDLSGGTTKIVKVITQEDVNKAKETISKRAGEAAPKELKDQLKQSEYFALDATLSSSAPSLTTSPNVGSESTEVTVTSTTVYNMLGVKENDLNSLVEKNAKDRIDSTKQKIQDNGLGKANISVINKASGGQTSLRIGVIVVAGPELDSESIAKEVAGKKRGETQQIIMNRPGIKDVEVSYSPFWVQSNPKKTGKITIIFDSAKNE